MLLCKLFRAHLAMCRGVWMDNQALHVGDVCQQREDFQRVDEFPCIFLSAIYFKGENACRTVRIIFPVKFMVTVGWKARMADTSDSRMSAQEIHNLECILNMALNPKWQTLNSLKQNPCIEW